MAGENSLRERWQDTFRQSAPYQSALRNAAIQKASRQQEGKSALKSAINRGDIRGAARIQQLLADEQAQPNATVQGLDNYQSQRATDYMDLARERGGEQAAEARTRPLSGIVNGVGFYDALENPDFSTFNPSANVRGVRMNFGGRDEGGFGDPNTDQIPKGKALARPTKEAYDFLGLHPETMLANDPSGSLRANYLNQKQSADALARHEQHFKTSLPPELSGAYDKYTATLSPSEKTDFFGQSPELRYGKLRSLLPRSNTPPASPADRLTMDNRPYSASNRGVSPLGSVGFSDVSMPTVKPVTASRPKAEVLPDYMHDYERASTAPAFAGPFGL